MREYLAQLRRAPAGCRALAQPCRWCSELGLDALPQTFLVAPDGGVLARWVGARDWDAPACASELDRVLKRHERMVAAAHAPAGTRRRPAPRPLRAPRRLSLRATGMLAILGADRAGHA